MATLILLRHGRTTANASGVLAGWTPETHLDDTGRTQASAIAESISAATTPVRLVTSPLVRCRETAAPLAERTGLVPEEHDGVGECHYGAWTGRPLVELSKEPLWKDVQEAPSGVTFPPSDAFEHESMRDMQRRAVETVRGIDAGVEQAHGASATWVAVSHGDVIKAVLADALGTPLDDFQRIVASPTSVSIVRYTSSRPFVLLMNHTHGGLRDVLTYQATSGSDATVGGSSGVTDTASGQPN